MATAQRFALTDLEVVRVGRGKRRIERASAGELAVALPDNWMSSSHARLVRDGDGWFIEDQKSKNGTWVNGERSWCDVLSDGDIIELGDTIFVFRASVPLRSDAIHTPTPEDAERGLATLNAGLEDQFRALRLVAPSRMPVLVRGETGTGKELAARAVHDLSGRRGAFVAVNCGALPNTLVESQLFGYRRGAFSGATSNHDGIVRASSGGTLFLDEIAELSEPSQVALLRVLQEREVLPVGETTPIRVDVRVVAATHQDLEARIHDGRFRKDLYARLAAFELKLPALAERREDIGLIVATLLRRIAPERAHKIKLRRGVGRALFAHSWPLNIRQLEQTLTTALVRAQGNELTMEHLPSALQLATATSSSEDPSKSPTKPFLDGLSDKDRHRRAILVDLFRTHRGNVSAVAKDLGKARNQIHRWVRKYAIEPDDYRR
jgi:DNA-binding NtrC family response regulator